MSTEFDGPDLLVGEIHAIRTFDLRADGSLWPVFAADRAWTAGVNEASCQRHRPAAASGCKCGYWAYGSTAALRDQTPARNVAAVISCWGRATPGTRGLRAQFARLDAIWLSHRVDEALRVKVAERYPGVPIFRDRAAMQAAHPLTALPSYQPANRNWKITLSRMLLRVMIATMLLLGCLPRHEVAAGALGRLHEQASLSLIYAGFIAIVLYFRIRVSLRLRSPHARVFWLSAGLAAWIWAPWASIGWQIPMRLPVVLWVLSMLHSQVRFVPTPVRGVRREPPDPMPGPGAAAPVPPT